MSRDIDAALDIPEFLKISAAVRRLAWERTPPRAMPAFGRELTETEKLYRASIERERAAKRAADEVRFQQMRAKVAAVKAERLAIAKAIKRQRRT